MLDKIGSGGLADADVDVGVGFVRRRRRTILSELVFLDLIKFQTWVWAKPSQGHKIYFILPKDISFQRAIFKQF